MNFVIVVDWKKPKINIFVLNVLQQLPFSVSESCQDAVRDVKIVTSCPTSKEEWDIAARIKNCSNLVAVAKSKNCTITEKQPEYHCLVNSLENKFIEFCADKRIIFGNIYILFFFLNLNLKVIIQISFFHKYI